MKEVKSTFEKLEENVGQLTITVSAEDFEEGMNASYHKNVRNLSIPGFRKGKAPRRVVEQYYGEGFLYEDAFEHVFPSAYEAAVAEHALEVVDRPDLDIQQIGKNQELIFTAKVTLKPVVELGQYKGIEVEEVEYNVTDDMIEAEVKRAQESAARYINVERPVENGDRVVIDYAGFVDKVPFDGGTADNQTLDIGSGMFIPGFEEQIIGMQAEEQKDINVTFPKEYHVEDLAGKDAVFTVKLHSVKIKELPEIDDELAKDISDFDTLEEYKADLRKKMEEQAAEAKKNAIENAAVGKAVENVKVTIPEVMVHAQFEGILQEFQYQLAGQGLKLEDYFQYSGMDQEKMYETYKGEAERRTKTQLTIEAICKAENIEVSDEEADAEIKSMAEKAGQPYERYKSLFAGDNASYLKDELRFRKAVELITSNAVMVAPKPAEDKEAPAEEK